MRALLMDKSDAKVFVDDCDSVEQFFTYVSPNSSDNEDFSELFTFDYSDSDNYSDSDSTENAEMGRTEKRRQRSPSPPVVVRHNSNTKPGVYITRTPCNNYRERDSYNKNERQSRNSTPNSRSSQSYSVDVENDTEIISIQQHRRIVFTSFDDQKSSNELDVDSPRSSPSTPVLSSRIERHSPSLRKLSSSSHRRSRSRWDRMESNLLARPMYKNHQLLGDSQFIRFAHHIVRYKWEREIQYCVSGQKTQDLLEMLVEAKYPIHNNVLIMIGTNDLIQKTNIVTWTNTYKNLISFLKNRTQKIVLVTVPPVPKMHMEGIHWETLERMNEFILGQKDGEHIFTVDITEIFSTNYNKTCNDYFERFYGNTDREDLIHFNAKGLKLIEALLNINYFNVE